MKCIHENLWSLIHVEHVHKFSLSLSFFIYSQIPLVYLELTGKLYNFFCCFYFGCWVFCSKLSAAQYARSFSSLSLSLSITFLSISSSCISLSLSSYSFFLLLTYFIIYSQVTFLLFILARLGKKREWKRTKKNEYWNCVFVQSHITHISAETESSVNGKKNCIKISEYFSFTTRLCFLMCK